MTCVVGCFIFYFIFFCIFYLKTNNNEICAFKIPASEVEQISNDSELFVFLVAKFFWFTFEKKHVSCFFSSNVKVEHISLTEKSFCLRQQKYVREKIFRHRSKFLSPKIPSQKKVFITKKFLSQKQVFVTETSLVLMLVLFS